MKKILKTISKCLVLSFILFNLFINSCEKSEPVTPEEAYEKHLSNVFVEFECEVKKILKDDIEGSKHQRFIVETNSNQTILISHNIDIADRVDIRVGSKLSVRGEYIWNEKGGLVHYTHPAKSGMKAGGWVKVLEY